MVTLLRALKRSRLVSVSALVQKEMLFNGNNPFCFGWKGIKRRPKGSNSLIVSKIDTIISDEMSLSESRVGIN